MSNPFKILHESHPRIWCITIFVPMVVITIVVVPMVFLYEFIESERENPIPLGLG